VVKGIKRDCIHYDWGKTAPREYGAFCAKEKTGLKENMCKNCRSYRDSKDEFNK